MSELVLYFPEEILSYFNNLSWSSVSSGFGSNWKNFADNFATLSGKGSNNLFLLIKFNRISIISLNVNVSGPTHSIICASEPFEIIW